MDSLAGIEMVAPGMGGLSNQDLEAVQRFTLLWTLFEAQVLGTNASVQKICNVVADLDAHVLDRFPYQEQLRYFKERYIERGEANFRFEQLSLRNNDYPDLVRSVLKGKNEDPRDQLVVCLIVVYRFRNNFFHGVKWAYGLQGQRENFFQSADLLESCLKVMR